MMTTYNSSKNNDEIIVVRDEYKTSLKKKFLKKIKYSLSLNFSFSFFDIVLYPAKSKSALFSFTNCVANRIRRFETNNSTIIENTFKYNPLCSKLLLTNHTNIPWMKITVFQ